MQHFTVPYGVLETGGDGILSKIIEKPEYDLWVNTGMYVIKKEVIKHIPEQTLCDFPELVSQIRKKGGKISVYPISQSSWVDTGQWQEYHGAIRKLDKKSDS